MAVVSRNKDELCTGWRAVLPRLDYDKPYLFRLEMTVKKCVLIAATLALMVGTAEAKNPHGDLPPGLQKKVERGGELPPGWQKKLVKGHVLDLDLYEYGSVYPYGDEYEKVYIEDKIVTVIRNTREIIDILDL